jgi:hypothetical protein
LEAIIVIRGDYNAGLTFYGNGDQKQEIPEFFDMGFLSDFVSVPRYITLSKPIAERRRPDRMEDEDDIKKEYADVFEAVEYGTGRDTNIKLCYASSCLSITCTLDVYAKATRLKRENWDIFFEEVYTECGDIYYDDFREFVHECIKEKFPDMWRLLDDKQTGFSGRSGGHFNLVFDAPYGFVAIRRCIDGFITYDLTEPDYSDVMKFVDDLDLVYQWIDELIVDYWNDVCEGIKEMKEEDRWEIEIYAPARALGAFLEMCSVQ